MSSHKLQVGKYVGIVCNVINKYLSDKNRQFVIQFIKPSDDYGKKGDNIIAVSGKLVVNRGVKNFDLLRGDEFN